MLQRFLTIADIPEIRSNPIQSDKLNPEVEVIIPVEIYPDVQEAIRNIRFAHLEGRSVQRAWAHFSRLILTCIVHERDRILFKRKLSSID